MVNFMERRQLNGSRIWNSRNIPKGTWDSDTQYEAANLVTHDGSSFLAHTQPPVGTPPTDPAYWQVSAAGTGKATADIPGTVKPDGKTLAIDDEGTLSAVQATQTSLGVIKGSDDVTVDGNGAVTVNTAFTQAAELANLIAGEAVREVLGKISKSIAATMNLDQNALLKNMLTNIDVNDREKIPTAALVHTLADRIGMGEDLAAGNNLTSAVNSLNMRGSTYQLTLPQVPPTTASMQVGGIISVPPGTYLFVLDAIARSTSDSHTSLEARANGSTFSLGRIPNTNGTHLSLCMEKIISFSVQTDVSFAIQKNNATGDVVFFGGSYTGIRLK